MIKQVPFKGGNRLTSNRYHFLGGTPADTSHWTTLANAVVAAEKATQLPSTTITSVVGYAAGSDVPVATISYSTSGTFSGAGGDIIVPGEVVALVRYSTAGRSSKNHPIYCFNYFHHVLCTTTAAAQDTLAPDLKTAYTTYAGDWVSGFSDGTNTYTRASPNGHGATGSTVEEYVTHRDFPYTRSL